MISYSTNWMGPVTTRWYEDNNIPMIEEERVYSSFMKSKAGETYISRTPSITYACGRIDIRGLDEQEYYDGGCEYGLGVMETESWNILSDFLYDYESSDLMSYDDLINHFETKSGHKIKWLESK